jgi:hypothetical protein
MNSGTAPLLLAADGTTKGTKVTKKIDRHQGLFFVFIVFFVVSRTQP